MKSLFHDTFKILFPWLEKKIDQPNTPEPIYFGVTQPTQYFVGREEEVQQLSELFLNRYGPIFSISGIGGQGKTELVRQFIKTLKNLISPPSIIWLRGDRANIFQSDISRLIQFLTIPSPENAIASDSAFQIWFNMSINFPNNWLVIIDNVDEMYFEFKQTIGVLIRHGAFVIVTTRRIDILSGEAIQMKLYVLKQEDAQLLVANFLDQSPNAEVKDLCNELGNHALALRQAISYISAQQNEIKTSYSIKNYLNDLDNDKKLLQSEVFLDGYEETIYLIVARTTASIQDKFPRIGEAAAKLMRILCLIQPDGISIQFLSKVLTRNPESVSEIQYPKLKDELHQALLLLKKFSLIFYDGESSVTIHRVTQKITKFINQPHDQYFQYIFDAIDFPHISKKELQHLLTVWEHVVPGTKKRSFNYIIATHNRIFHLLSVRLTKAVAEQNCVTETRKIENCLHAILENVEYRKVLRMLKEVPEKEMRVHGESYPEALYMSLQIDYIMLIMNKFEQDVQWYEEMLNLQIRLYGSDHEDTMRIRIGMAIVLQAVGRADEALLIFLEVSIWERKNLGEFHRSTLSTDNNIGILLLKRKQFEEAKEKFEFLLSQRQAALGKEDQDTLISQEGLALTLWELGNEAEAVMMMTEVLNLRDKVLGPDDPLTQFSRSVTSHWETVIKAQLP